MQLTIRVPSIAYLAGALDPPGLARIDNPSSFGEDAAGELYIVDQDDGEIYKIIAG